ncbi:NAD-dependent deacylase [soil metagenome]
MPISAEARRQVNRVAKRIGPDTSLLFITGAGLSADSGLPTYRGIGGLYADDRDTPEGLPIELLLSGSMFRTRPELTWTYLHEVGRAAAGATFNRGHAVIADLEARLPRVWTLTQNVDGFHHAAGSRNVIEIHGNIHKIICTCCDYQETIDNFEQVAELPLCPLCSAVVRPDVILFGEELPTEQVVLLGGQLAIGFDLVLSVGTSSLFPYIQEPVLRAKSSGGLAVEINPVETAVSEVVDVRIEAGAAEALEALWERVVAEE